MREVYICDAVRTPVGKYGGSLAAVRTDDLAAIPLKALMERNPAISWSDTDDVIIGCANQAGKTTGMLPGWLSCWPVTRKLSPVSP
jgi:acetyl-CoA acetyltransferase